MLNTLNYRNFLYNINNYTHMKRTFNLLEWGSVHTKPASINFTSFNPFNFFKHSDKSSLDSNAAGIHSAGGWRYLSKKRNINLRKLIIIYYYLVFYFEEISHLSQCLQNCKVACLGIPCVMSTWVRRQPTHIWDGFGSIKVPHSQHILYNERKISSISNM